jgi:hypothetical protein
LPPRKERGTKAEVIFTNAKFSWPMIQNVIIDNIYVTISSYLDLMITVNKSATFLALGSHWVSELQSGDFLKNIQLMALKYYTLIVYHWKRKTVSFIKIFVVWIQVFVAMHKSLQKICLQIRKKPVQNIFSKTQQISEPMWHRFLSWYDYIS